MITIIFQVSCFKSFKRIMRIPISLACTIWLYLLAVAYEIMEDLGCWNFPVMENATFSFDGFFRIVVRLRIHSGMILTTL